MRRAAAVTMVLLLLAACGSVPDKVRDALDSAIAATASVSTALENLDDGKGLTPYTDTVIGDALSELDSAASDLVQSGPAGEAAQDRDAALAAIRSATDAVLEAREAVSRGDDLDGSIEAIDDATATLTDLS